MYLAVSYELLSGPHRESAAAALSALRVSALELPVDVRHTVPAISSAAPVSHTLSDEPGARACRADLHSCGLRLSALSLNLDPSTESEEAMVARLTVAIAAADVLGAPVVGVALASRCAAHEGISLLMAACRATAPSRVALALNMAASPGAGELLRRELAGDSTGRLGITLDPGGLYQAGVSLDEVRDAIRWSAPFTRRFLCRNLREMCAARHPCPLAEGDLDYAHALCLLGAAGYTGAVTVAGAPPDDAASPVGSSWLRADVQFVRELLGEAE